MAREISTSSPMETIGSSPRSALFSLPRELRDDIYRHAFVNGAERTVIVAIEKWLEDERARRRQHARVDGQAFAPRAMPTCPLTGLIVNKQFFDEAAEAFLRYQTIQCDFVDTFGKFCKSSQALQMHLTRFHCEWGTSAHRVGTYLPSFFASLKKCKNLRKLSVMIHDEVFDVLPNRLVCSQYLTTDDFKDILEVYDLLEMPTLEQVEFSARFGHLATTSQERRTWRSNVAAFETCINASLQMRKGRVKAHGKEEGSPIYSPVSGFRDMKIAVSGYSSKSRKRLENLIRVCGAEIMPEVQTGTTHLITASTSAEKYRSAWPRNLPIVNQVWLEDSFAFRAPQSTTEYRYQVLVEQEPRLIKDIQVRCEEETMALETPQRRNRGSETESPGVLGGRIENLGSTDLDSSSAKDKLRQTTRKPLGMEPTGIRKLQKKTTTRLKSCLVDNASQQHAPSSLVIRHHFAMTAGLALAVSTVNTVVLWKLLSR